MLAAKDSNISDAVMTIKQLSEEEYFRLCCEAQEDRIRCQNGLINRLEEQGKTIEEKDKMIEEQDKTIEEQDKTIESQGMTIEELKEENLRLKQQIAKLSNI